LNTPDEEVTGTNSNIDRNSFSDAINCNRAESISSVCHSHLISNSTSAIDRSETETECVFQQVKSVVNEFGCSTDGDISKTLSPILLKSADHQSLSGCSIAQVANTSGSEVSFPGSGSVSSIPGFFSPRGMFPVLCSSLYSASDVKPVIESAPFNFTQVVASHPTDSFLPSAAFSSSGHFRMDASENSQISSDRNSKYNHLSGGMVTGTSGTVHATQ